MTALKPVYRAGRIVGFRDENNHPVPLREGIAGDVPVGQAPLVRQVRGQLVFSGGSADAVEALADTVERAVKSRDQAADPEEAKALGKETEPWERPQDAVESLAAREAVAPKGSPRRNPTVRQVLKGR